MGSKQRVGGELSKEVRVTSGVHHGSALCPPVFLAYVNYVRNIESSTRLLVDDCIIYRKISNNNYMESLQIDLNRLGE
jgi:hypothetical protein